MKSKEQTNKITEYKFSYWQIIFFVILHYVAKVLAYIHRNIPFSLKFETLLCLIYIGVYTVIHYLFKHRSLSDISLGEVILFNLLSIVVSFLLVIGIEALF